jgi:taurine dioxygenase
MMALTMEIEPLSPILGARIRGIDWHQYPDAVVVEGVKEAFTRYSVLCFPDQKITPRDQAIFAAIFGRVDDGYRPHDSEERKRSASRSVMLVSNIRKNGKPVGQLPDGEMQFHSDGAHRASPYRATTLFAVKIPSRGGETKFANLHAAFDALSASLQERLEGLQVNNVYDYDAVIRDTSIEGLSTATHPLVKTHPNNGRKALYLSRLMSRSIVGMDAAESENLLEELFDHIERPEFVYAHAWTAGELLIWDNRSLNHARNDFPAAEMRLLRRYTVSEPDAG